MKQNGKMKGKMNENMKTRSAMTGISMLKIDGIGICSLINNNNKTGGRIKLINCASD